MDQTQNFLTSWCSPKNWKVLVFCSQKVQMLASGNPCYFSWGQFGYEVTLRKLYLILPPARCGISCKFCNVANYIVHCLNAHLMVGEFIILYSCEIQSSGGKFKTSFINRKRNIRKGFILLWIPFDTYTGINLSIQSGGVRTPSI